MNANGDEGWAPSNYLENLVDYYIDQAVASQYIDLTPFRNLQANQCDQGIYNCDYLNRIYSALSYYDLFCNHKIEKDEFLQFCQDIYINFLDDYYHFIKAHDHHLPQIKEQLESKYSLKQCDLSHCEIIGRHYREPRESNDNKEDSLIDLVESYHTDCYDRLHHQIFHLEGIGMRVNQSTEEKEEYHDNDEDNEKGIDFTFKRMKERIFFQRTKFLSARNFQRLENENNKFNVITNNDDQHQSGLQKS